MENVIVTIARQYGSGGKTIGEMYAKDQGINCYSREILRMASDDSGINEMLFNQADERLKGTTLFGWAKKVYKGDLIPPESDDFVSDRNLFNYQAKVIKQLAEQELSECGQCLRPCTYGLLHCPQSGTFIDHL